MEWSERFSGGIRGFVDGGSQCPAAIVFLVSTQMTPEDSRIRLLVVDDEQSIRRLCVTVGGALGYLCSEAESAEAVLAQSPAITPDIVIAHLRLPKLSRADLLRQNKSRLPATEVVIMTGHGSIESPVAPLHLATYNSIQTPFP